MRKLHKKYIILNVFLIVYILSLSLGYAYFSESLEARGTAKTISYYTNPIKFYLLTDTSDVGSIMSSTSLGSIATITKTSTSTYAVTDYITLSSINTRDVISATIYVSFIQDVTISDYTVTMVDNDWILDSSTAYGQVYTNNQRVKAPNGWSTYIQYSEDVDVGDDTFEDGGYTVYGVGDIYCELVFNDTFGKNTSTKTKTLTFNISYKSQGKTWNNTYKMIFTIP